MTIDKSAPAKCRWDELDEEDGEDLDFLLPPKRVIGPDEGGMSKRAVEGPNWPKFGDAVHDDAGSRLTMVSTEEILLERPRAPGSKADESKMAGDGLAQLTKGGAVLPRCRTCGKNGDHWTSHCPYKGLDPPTENLVDKPSAFETAGLGSRMIEGDFGLRPTRAENLVQVTNLSENTTDSDLLELFREFGPVNCVCVRINAKSGVSMGKGFVNFVNMEDAERAINDRNGYGYDGLILRVAWARPDLHE